MLETIVPFSTVKIATTKSQSFIHLGEKKDSLIQLNSLSSIGDCRRFQHLLPSSSLDHFDLIFVAPLQADFDPSLKDIRYLIPDADSYNTYFFSEYNDSLDKPFDFHTGIGRGRDGMFFVDIPFSRSKKILQMYDLKKDKYSVCYIAETIVNSRSCYKSFFEMIAKKYRASSSFSIVVPEWIAKDIKDKGVCKEYKKYFSTIVVVTKTDKKVYEYKDDGYNNTLYIRGDIFPVPNHEMMIVLKNSADDILLTGDQSITDALSCCPRKNIWYQIAPWKEGYAKELARLLPNKYYKSKKTSCGTMTALSLRSDYRKFVTEWDFRKCAKGRLTKIVNLAISRKNDRSVRRIFEELK